MADVINTITYKGTVYTINGLMDMPISNEGVLDTDDNIQILDEDDNVIVEIDADGVKVSSITDLDGNPISNDNIYSSYLDVNYNTGVLEPFLLKYLNKDTDDFGQLNIHLCGDSIFGRQDKGSSWDSDNPEISLTPDCNDDDETQAGYITGHFPPNAWEQLVGYKLTEYLQYKSAGVKYYNHVSSEITKTGTWTDLFPVGSDCLRLCSNSVNGDSISLSFSNAKYAKFIVSNYNATTSNATIKVEISNDDGTTYYIPSYFGLSESLDDNGVSGEYSLTDLATLKFAEICFAGFDESESYIIRVTHTNSSALRVWGFETWYDKRINIINCAEGGNTVGNQNNRPKRFWNSNSNPSLIIYELPYLNDLGYSAIPSSIYMGGASLSTTPTASLTDGVTYYCEEDGEYVNFDGIEAHEGDYISYDADSGKWILGSPYLTTKLTAYCTNVRKSLKRVKMIGIPALCLITHDGSWYANRQLGYLWGIPILRCLTKELGFATIDVNAYQHSLDTPASLVSSPSDGTHLNDTGVNVYTELIKQCIPLSIPNSIGTPKWDNGEFYGTGEAGEITFDGNIECCKTPLIAILDNPDIIVSNITNTGFTATGSGTFTYKAIVNY